MLAWPATPQVVHLVGKLTDAVVRVLGPTTEALRQAGQAQVIVLIEDPSHPGLVDWFHPDVELVVLPAAKHAIARWRRWLRATRHVLARGRIDTIHFHGFLPSALAGSLLDTAPVARIMFSPHDSRSQQQRTHLQRMVSALARPWLRSLAANAVVAMPSEARVMAGVSNRPVALIGVPVHQAYFMAAGHPARRPLVAGGVFDEPEAMAMRFAQLAVLVGAGSDNMAFNWVGAVRGRAREQLEAAGIGIFDTRDPTARASRLATAWLFLCPHGERGFPGQLTEAMACGLPIVAVDTAIHRDIVVDGVTGFLCSDDRSLVLQVARLLADEPLRLRMGSAARQATLQRFGGASFEAALLQAYAESKASHELTSSS